MCRSRPSRKEKDAGGDGAAAGIGAKAALGRQPSLPPDNKP